MAVPNNSKDFRALVVNLVKCAGQDLIDRAEDLVGNGDLISDFDICITFPINDHWTMDGLPEIEVCRKHIVDGSLKIIMEHYDNKRNDQE